MCSPVSPCLSAAPLLLRIAPGLLAILAAPASRAQDSAIVGGIDHGRPYVAPVPRQLPAFTIRETHESRLPDRKVTVHKVENPGIPLPEKPKAAPPADPALREARRLKAEAWLAAHPEHRPVPLMISATVVEGRASLVSWWYAGQEYRAWSNVDFHLLTGFSDFRKGDTHYHAYFGVGNLPASRKEDARFAVPASLPADGPGFILVRGNPADAEALAPMHALHEICRTDGERLHQARLSREAHRAAEAARLRLHPPVPEDIVVYFWEPPPEPPRPVAWNRRLPVRDGIREPRPARSRAISPAGPVPQQSDAEGGAR